MTNQNPVSAIETDMVVALNTANNAFSRAKCDDYKLLGQNLGIIAGAIFERFQCCSNIETSASVEAEMVTALRCARSAMDRVSVPIPQREANISVIAISLFNAHIRKT